MSHWPLSDEVLDDISSMNIDHKHSAKFPAVVLA